MSDKKYYVTTPIYYPSSNLHIGHTYCTVATDAIARYKRMQGYDVMFLTGTDEHGQKIENNAKAAGVTPKEFVDRIVEGPRGVKDLWKLMNISYDRFIRTTDDYHVAAIQKIFKEMYDKGDIYKGKYTGKYCVPCESFWTESQLVDGKCPDCGREVIDAEEEAYFFRASKYADRVRDLLLNTDFLEPRIRVNEMINNFIDCEGGLQDLCVSRTSFKWGVPVDFDPGHVVYVWLDALFNYTTALGYMNDEYNDMEKFWPADVHIVGKEIVRFHSIYWPAFLMSMGAPLPKKVYGHGWLNFNGEKMSKSRGNVVDPYILAEKFGVDSLRFFLLRTFPFGSDGNFTNELLIQTINTDLANDLGNLVSRTTAMSDRYFSGDLAQGGELTEADGELKALAAEVTANYERQMDAFQFSNALSEVWRLISRANKYIDENSPWVLAKDEAKRPRLLSVLKNLCEAIRVAAILVSPVMPDTAEAIFERLGVPAGGRVWDAVSFDLETEGFWKTTSGAPLFPRIDVEKELASLDAILEAEQAKAAAPAKEEAPKADAKKPEPAEASEPEHLPQITIDDFMSVELRAAKVYDCEPVPKSDKLLRIQVDLGYEKRQIVSGIRAWYSPEDLIGKTIVVVANLKPAKLRGVESNGMLLAADTPEGGASVIFLPDDVPAGQRIH